MSIQAQSLETWIGAQVQDRDGDKVGKVSDVFFRGEEPLVVAISSGLGGRKHHLAILRGSNVTFDSLDLAVSQDQLVKGDGTLTKEALAELAEQDSRLKELDLAVIEGYQEREARRQAADAAREKADKLEAEAAKAAEDEKHAADKAKAAANDAEKARKAREEADKKAREAREEARAAGG